MSGIGSNFAGGIGTSTLLPPRNKNSTRNRTDIKWEYEIDVLEKWKKVKCNYCSKINNGGIFISKDHLVGIVELLS